MNRSSAVMQQRSEPADSLDYFPTPPWATRALCEYVIKPSGTVLEPACGEGDMAKPLGEYFNRVFASDIFNYGYGSVSDYLTTPNASDWMITNPPFNLALDFILKGLDETTKGVAVLVRSAFFESKGRYVKLFKDRPPTTVAPFVERVAMLKGRLDRNAGSATSYAWFVWEHGKTGTEMVWIPPCKAELDKDYDWK